MKGRYILAYKVNRKDAARHIDSRHESIKEAFDKMCFESEKNPKFTYTIYNRLWVKVPIETISEVLQDERF